MTKPITAAELAQIVNKLLAGNSGEVETTEAFSGFMTEIAKVICDYCGGEVRHPASPLDDVWYVGIHENDSLPDASGGIWSEFDPEGELFETHHKSKCSDCGQTVSSLMGCPDGAEVCQDCFNAGAH